MAIFGCLCDGKKNDDVEYEFDINASKVQGTLAYDAKTYEIGVTSNIIATAYTFDVCSVNKKEIPKNEKVDINATAENPRTAYTEYEVESNVDWCTATPEEGKTSVFVKKNTSGDKRTATLTFTQGNVTSSVTISQESAEIGKYKIKLDYVNDDLENKDVATSMISFNKQAIKDIENFQDITDIVNNEYTIELIEGEDTYSANYVKVYDESVKYKDLSFTLTKTNCDASELIKDNFVAVANIINLKATKVTKKLNESGFEVTKNNGTAILISYDDEVAEITNSSDFTITATSDGGKIEVQIINDKIQVKKIGEINNDITFTVEAKLNADAECSHSQTFTIYASPTWFVLMIDDKNRGKDIDKNYLLSNDKLIIRTNDGEGHTLCDKDSTDGDFQLWTYEERYPDNNTEVINESETMDIYYLKYIGNNTPYTCITETLSYFKEGKVAVEIDDVPTTENVLKYDWNDTKDSVVKLKVTDQGIAIVTEDTPQQEVSITITSDDLIQSEWFVTTQKSITDFECTNENENEVNVNKDDTTGKFTINLKKPKVTVEDEVYILKFTTKGGKNLTQFKITRNAMSKNDYDTFRFNITESPTSLTTVENLFATKDHKGITVSFSNGDPYDEGIEFNGLQEYDDDVKQTGAYLFQDDKSFYIVSNINWKGKGNENMGIHFGDEFYGEIDKLTMRIGSEDDKVKGEFHEDRNELEIEIDNSADDVLFDIYFDGNWRNLIDDTKETITANTETVIPTVGKWDEDEGEFVKLPLKISPTTACDWVKFDERDNPIGVEVQPNNTGDERTFTFNTTYNPENFFAIKNLPTIKLTQR